MTDRETVMSTSVESDKRDRVGIMSPPAGRWYPSWWVGCACVLGGGVSGTIPVKKSERGALYHRKRANLMSSTCYS